jgi:putative transposase
MELFNNWIAKTSIPQCGPNTILVIDNALIHLIAGLYGIVEDASIHIEYLPPYSPDLNTIEQSLNVLKAWI